MAYVSNKRILIEMLERYGFNFKKMYGQNFLIDQNILRKIVKTSGLNETEIALEVGPGVGALTQILAESAKQVYSFEIDSKLEPMLSESLSAYNNVEIIFNDFLKVELAQWYNQLPTQLPLRLIANLPYYITTPILEKVLEWFATTDVDIKSATVMMQKEVAMRLVAKAGTKEYGSLSIFIQLFSDVQIAFTVPKNVFLPAPNVDSAIVQLNFKQCTLFENYQKIQKFLAFVRTCFTARRKTLMNNLKKQYPTPEIISVLSECQIAENIRAEQLDVYQFIDLFQKLS